MRADRLLTVLMLLQAHGKQTGRELAARLEVSERTIHRDMDALSAAGVPIVAVRGPRGGWQLDESWRSKVPALDEQELRAFLMAQPRVVGDQRLAAAAQRALDKLMATLPLSMRARAASLRQRLHVDTAGWWGAMDELEALPIVQDAVSRDRKLAFAYRRPSGELVERVVDPLGMVAKGATWYLVANTPNGLRTYRVSRIDRPVLRDEPCVRPPDFDLAAYWESSTKEFIEARSRYAARLRLHPRAAARIRAWRMCAPRNENDTTDADGWVTLHLQFENEEQALFVALGFGPEAQVLEPAGLRDRVRQAVEEMAAVPA